MTSDAVFAARTRLVQAALRVLDAHWAEEHAFADADAELADEQLALAARDLTRAVHALPAEDQPVGWVTP